MATNAERQAKYRARQRHGELRAVRVILSHEDEMKLRYLVQHTGGTRTELIRRLILEEWDRQGRPVPGEE